MPPAGDLQSHPTSHLRIGVDATCWANERGYGRFTREIVAAMTSVAAGDRFVCFLDPVSAGLFDLDRPNIEKVMVELNEPPVHAASRKGNRSLRDILAMTRAVREHELDAIFFPSVYTWFPLFPGIPSLVTLHDAIPERFPALTLPSKRARLFWGLKVKLALRQASRVLAVSDFAARDITKALGVDRSRIIVAGEAPAAAFTPSAQEDIAGAAERLGLPAGAQWFIYVGGFNPHKNVVDIVRAHAVVARAAGGRAPYLLLVGTLDRDVYHSDRPAIERAIAEEHTGSLVRWTGFVADAELRHLHSGAIALLMPSAAEGFGLPAIEAAACGTPAIATTESPLPELLAGGGIFVEPGDCRALASAMLALAGDPEGRQRWGDIARERAAALDWNVAAETVLGALRGIAA
jgi:glycosyltransferase involved in cell wall biosynthesis